MALPHEPRLRILITNITLDGRSGTEIVTRDLAIGLAATGHRPMVYSPQVGGIAREIVAAGVPVFASIDEVGEVPDIIHGHHTLQTAVAAARFPQSPGIFVCHDFVAWHDAPPGSPNIVGHVAVGDATHERLTAESGLSPSAVDIIENGVDVDRFRPGPALPDRPRNALIIAKSRIQVDPILEACALRGIAATVTGPAVGKLLHAPEAVMPEFDLVFASGLTAIEAMACLRPVIVCDGRGLAGLVTARDYPAWRRQNFGLRSLAFPLTTANILRELDRYSAPEAASVGLLLRSQAALPAWIARYLSLYRRCIREFAATGQDRDHASKLVALQLQNRSSPVVGDWMRECRLLRDEVTTLQVGLRPLEPGKRVPVSATDRIGLHGFHSREDWGAWSARTYCTAMFRIPAMGAPLALQVECIPYLTPRHPAMDVTCLVNGEAVAAWSSAGEPSTPAVRTVALPAGLEHADSLVFLSFRTSHVASPRSEYLSMDPRPLGIGLLALTLVAAGPEDSKAAVPAAAAPPPGPPTAGADAGPEMAVVVMAYKAPRSLVAAVRSIVAQVPATEVVVVNTGGGDARRLLADAGLNVDVIETRARLLPGGTRNLGIEATRAPLVAFLAADCTTGPGWVSARLRAHRQGHAAVASSLICHQPRNPVALAAHLSLFCRRMPRTPPGDALAYGASYSRHLFAAHGLFRADMRGGEDTDFHLRLAAAERPSWQPEIRTVHFGASSLPEFAVDQFRRGRRAAEAWYAINRWNRRSFAWQVFKRTGATIRMSLRVVAPADRAVALLALPLILVGGIAYTLGALDATTDAAAAAGRE